MDGEKVDIQTPELVWVDTSDTLRKQADAIESVVLSVPSGALRNALTDANIHVRAAVDLLEKIERGEIV